MHFAVGMGCGGALAGTACLIFRRGWRFLPAAMTAGGLWALLPDLPRVFREDFPNLPFAAALGQSSFERFLHRAGDLFCFHAQLDAQPKEYALAGFAIIIFLYNLSIGLLMLLEHRQRDSIANRAWQAHRPHIRPRRDQAHRHDPSQTPFDPTALSSGPPVPAALPPLGPHVPMAPMPPLPGAAVQLNEHDDPVIHRINPEADRDAAGNP
jgi:hypothetical protein